MSDIEVLLRQMDLPEFRRDVSKPENVAWLLRNIQVRNSDNPFLGEAQALLRSLMLNKRVAAVPEKYEGIDFKPPTSVADEAEKGLDYRRRSGKGGLSSQEAGEEGIGSGVQRAVNLKNRNNISPDTIQQMLNFFSRSKKNKSISPENKKTPWEDAGYVAWLLWGGDAGKSWAEKIKKQMEEADEKEKAEAEKSKTAELFGPRAPLMEVPQAKLTYRVKSDDWGLVVAVIAGNKRIGGMDAYQIGGFNSLRCAPDILKLLEIYPEMEDLSRPRWKPETPRIEYLAVSHSVISDESFRGLGVGVAMYLAAMGAWFDKKGPFFFMPDYCSGAGFTSKDAMRVWESLKKKFPHSGDVLAVMHRPRVPSGPVAVRPL